MIIYSLNHQQPEVTLEEDTRSLLEFQRDLRINIEQNLGEDNKREIFSKFQKFLFSFDERIHLFDDPSYRSFLCEIVKILFENYFFFNFSEGIFFDIFAKFFESFSDDPEILDHYKIFFCKILPKFTERMSEIELKNFPIFIKIERISLIFFEYAFKTPLENQEFHENNNVDINTILENLLFFYEKTDKNTKIIEIENLFFENLKKIPKFEVFFLVGKAFFFEKEFQRSKSYIEKSIRMFSDFKDKKGDLCLCHFFLGRIFQESKDFYNAINEFSISIITDETYSCSFFCRGVCYFELYKLKHPPKQNITLGIDVKNFVYDEVKILIQAYNDFNKAKEIGYRFSEEEEKYFNCLVEEIINGIPDIYLKVKINEKEIEIFEKENRLLREENQNLTEKSNKRKRDDDDDEDREKKRRKLTEESQTINPSPTIIFPDTTTNKIDFLYSSLKKQNLYFEFQLNNLKKQIPKGEFHQNLKKIEERLKIIKGEIEIFQQRYLSEKNNKMEFN